MSVKLPVKALDRQLEWKVRNASDLDLLVQIHRSLIVVSALRTEVKCKDEMIYQIANELENSGCSCVTEEGSVKGDYIVECFRIIFSTLSFVLRG